VTPHVIVQTFDPLGRDPATPRPTYDIRRLGRDPACLTDDNVHKFDPLGRDPAYEGPASRSGTAGWGLRPLPPRQPTLPATLRNPS